MSFFGQLDAAGVFIFGMMAAVALYGVFCVILLVRRIAQKRFANEAAAEQYLSEVRNLLGKRDFDGIADLCDSPVYWAKAVPQLVLVAIDNRDRPLPKIRRMLAEKFERDILADLEYRMSWISTIVKSAPMLGLLGTVVGMINAFAKLAVTSGAGSDPKLLANDISFALLTTAVGLLIAIPLVLAGNMIHVRIGKLQDAVEQHLGLFLDDFEVALTAQRGEAR